MRGREGRLAESKRFNLYDGYDLRLHEKQVDGWKCERKAGIVWRLGKALALVLGWYRKMILLC